MKSFATRTPKRSSSQGRHSVSLLLLLAFGIRLLYVPYHLAHEEHLGPGGHLVLSHSSVEEAHVDPHGHDHDHDDAHEHDDGHAPHSALDHALELITQNVNPHDEVHDVVWVLLDFEAQQPESLSRFSIHCRAPRAPDQRVRAPGRPRSPPITV